MNFRATSRDVAAGTPLAPDAMEFELFFESNRRGLFRALYLITGNVGAAEDLTQDAFLKVWERWDRVGEMSGRTGYLYRVAMTASRSRYRRLVLAAKEAVTARPDEDPYAAADTRDVVVRAVRTLPRRQRAALVLIDLLDYSSEAAGGLLGVKPATARNLAAQARSSMKRAMEASDE
jgi:RNA polymerase sigma-70 factor, ECF subfamily